LPANLGRARASMLWEKSAAKSGLTVARSPLFVEGCGRWRCKARVMSPVPQQRSRMLASGRARMGRRVRAARVHQRRSREKERRWLARS